MKCSLGISNFLEEISSVSHSGVFLYFFALIPEEGLLISSCYSLELCIQMLIFPFLKWPKWWTLSGMIQSSTKCPLMKMMPQLCPSWKHAFLRFPAGWLTPLKSYFNFTFPMRTPPTTLFNTATCPCFSRSTSLTLQFLYYIALTIFIIFSSFTHMANPALLPQLLHHSSEC